MKIIDVQQGTPEWFEARAGKLTASNAQCIATNGKGLETYVYSLLAEKYSNNRNNYINADMERGKELEEQARMTYEIENEKVEQVGFVELDELTGCSPDGLIGEDGGLEIKCPNDTNYFRLLINGEKEIKSDYIWQVQMCLYVTGRKWWKLAYYNPNFDKNMLVFRLEPELAKQEKLIVGIEKGKQLINELTKKYEQ